MLALKNLQNATRRVNFYWNCKQIYDLGLRAVGLRVFTILAVLSAS